MKKSLLIPSSFILIITIFLLPSCNKDSPCSLPVAGENYTLSDTIQSYISNYIDTEKIIFTTDQGAEVSFIVDNSRDTAGEYQHGDTCQEDNSKMQTVKGTSQLIQVLLVNLDEVPQPIYISLVEFPTAITNVKESISVTLGNFLSNSYEAEDGLFGFELNGTNNEVIFYDSLTINNKTFYSVFEAQNIFSTPKFDIKYTNNEGIIFIGNPENGRTYVYERKE